MTSRRRRADMREALRAAIAADTGAPPAARAAPTAAAAVLALETVGCLLLWAPIPAAWMWVGARMYDLTGSIMADLTVALAGFIVTTSLTMAALNRIDAVWIRLRRHAGHEQARGALDRIVVASMALGILAFQVWYYLSGAFVIPFMPTQ